MEIQNFKFTILVIGFLSLDFKLTLPEIQAHCVRTG